jgi:hypothetical protein
MHPWQVIMQYVILRTRSLSGLPTNTVSSSGNFIWMAGICLDRLLKQRSALDRRFSIACLGALAKLGKTPRSLSDLPMNTIFSSGNLAWMARICLDRLLKQRSALRKPGMPFGLPPQRGGSRSLSVGADCIAPAYRALSELLS